MLTTPFPSLRNSRIQFRPDDPTAGGNKSNTYDSVRLLGIDGFLEHPGHAEQARLIARHPRSGKRKRGSPAPKHSRLRKFREQRQAIDTGHTVIQQQQIDAILMAVGQDLARGSATVTGFEPRAAEQPAVGLQHGHVVVDDEDAVTVTRWQEPYA